MNGHLHKRLLGGIGSLSGPAFGKQFDCIVILFKQSLPKFAKSAIKAGVSNENGLNRKLCRYLQNIAQNKHLPFIIQPESMEDENRGDSPAVDIGVYLSITDANIDPPKITVFEGKRLTVGTKKFRQKEYVIGHDKDGKYKPCGGIERFKLSLHGRNFSRAGMIGYIQDGTPNSWHNQINAWIDELTRRKHSPTWSIDELLSPVFIEAEVGSCSSIVCRLDDEMQLVHLWIELLK